ncbi:MAG: succinate dehydrogenase assembly factor 2 [Betaproteobacteria bacterium]
MAGAAPIDERRLRRIRWRCRRGLLENDLVLARFLDANATSLTEDDVASLDALLDLDDNALWEVICGRSEPQPAHAGFVLRLQGGPALPALCTPSMDEARDAVGNEDDRS